MIIMYLYHSLEYYIQRKQNDNVSDQVDEMSFEIRRLQSFVVSPTLASPMRLAQSGFYATGQGDATRCYSCGLTYKNWQLLEKPDEIHKCFSPTCPHTNRVDERNIPLDNSPVQDSVENDKIYGILGEYMTGDLQNDEPALSGSATRAVPAARAASELAEQTGSGAESSQAAYPQYRQLKSRLDSFRGWRFSDVQMPEKLAEAGFYYAGFEDCIRCYTCALGLRSWQIRDDPWEEHARWRATCSHLLSSKGEQFVIKTLSNTNHPFSFQKNAARLTSQTWHGSDGTESAIAKAVEMGYFRSQVDRTLSHITPSTAGSETIELEGLVEKLLIMDGESSEDCECARDLLLADVAISGNKRPLPEPQAVIVANDVTSERAIPSSFPFRRSNSSRSFTPRSEAEMRSSDQPRPRKNTSHENRRRGRHSSLKHMKDENQAMRDESMCKICMDSPSCIVFLPCGHLVTCAECAPAMNKCPICRALVRGTIRTYNS